MARSIALLASVAGTWTIAWAASLAIALFVAAYVASEHMTSVLPKRWQRILAGVAVLVLPGTVQTLGLLGQVQWYAMIYLLAWLVAGSANRIALGAFALTGPYAVLFAPLILLRRPAGWPVVLAGGLVQTIAFMTTPRGASLELDRFAEVLAFRAVPGVFLGEVNASGIPVVFVITAAGLVAAAVISDRQLWPVFAGGATVAVFGLLFAGETNMQLLAGSGSRYFLALTFGLVLFVLRSPRSPLAWAIATLLMVGTVDDLRIPSRDYFGWP